MAQNISAVIFDLDGTLVDSEPVYRKSERWLAESLGVPFRKESSDKFIGVSTEEYMKWFRESYGLSLSIRELCDLQTQLFLEHGIEDVGLFGGPIAFLQFLHSHNIPLGLASGSDSKIIRALLRQLQLESYFGVWLSSSEVGASKPAPDVLIECARRLGQELGKCLVLEDSVPGMRAAQAAGMPVITINSQPESLSAKMRIAALRQADLFFSSMAEFDLGVILRTFSIGELGRDPPAAIPSDCCQ